ncbi:MAG TPA: methyltransferase domain-containing protein [Pyrinomonadaceae bacterium]|jgi:SAM-dependent methyltransferase
MSKRVESETENLWAYGKRLRFVRQAIEDVFPGWDARALRVLDVGCGNGTQLALALARLGFNVTGIDLDARSVEHARALALGLPRARFLCRDVEELEGLSFEVVILSEVLEHVAEPRALLGSSVGRLSAGGLLIVTVPNGYGEFELDSQLFRVLRLQRLVDVLARHRQGDAVAGTDNHASGHVQFFTRGRLQRLFAECSLRVLRAGAGSLLAGPLVGHTLARSSRFIRWNARASDRLPLVLASGWYFALGRRSGREAEGQGGV